MAWSLRLRLYGECRLGGEPAEPAEVELSLRRAGLRRLALNGKLCCPALGERALDGVWHFPGTLALELGDGWTFRGTLDRSAPRSLLGGSLWTGALLHDRGPRGELWLRLDLRHDWPALLRSLRRV